MYFVGFTEALLSNLGERGSLLTQYCTEDGCPGLPDSNWFRLAYGSAVLLFCLIVCLVGAGTVKNYKLIIYLCIFVFSIPLYDCLRFYFLIYFLSYFLLYFLFYFLFFRSFCKDNIFNISSSNVFNCYNTG